MQGKQVLQYIVNSAHSVISEHFIINDTVGLLLFERWTFLFCW